MSWWVSLRKDDEIVPVDSFEAGGTYCLGGSEEADLNITYNYSEFYYKHLDKEAGLRWLHGRKAKDCLGRLPKASVALGIERDDDYWAATPGNAGRALVILLNRAKLNPEAIFNVN